MNEFTVKTSEAGFADLFLDGKQVGFIMSYNWSYGYWKASIWDKDLEAKLSSVDVHYYAHNTRKALVERLNKALKKSVA